MSDTKLTSTKQSCRILKQGYLLKKSDLLKKWNLRYFVLSKECLCYYQSEQESSEEAPKELIFFNDLSLYIDDLPEKHTKYCLKIVKKSLSNKLAPRTYTLCCFSEQERNEWLAQILHAKAMSLVADPAWIGNEETSSEISDLKRSKSTSETRFATAKNVIQTYRKRLSFNRNLHPSPSCLSLYDMNANRVLSANSNWKATLTNISAGMEVA